MLGHASGVCSGMFNDLCSKGLNSTQYSEGGWGFSYNRLSYNGLSYNNLAILRQDSAITGLSYNKKGKSYNGKSYNRLSYNGLSYYNAWTVL